MRAIQAESVSSEPSPSPRAKAQRTADALTPAEVGQLHHLRRRGAAPATGEAEVAGYAAAVYEDAYGYKGQLGTGGESIQQFGSNTGVTIGAILLGATLMITAGSLQETFPESA